MKGRVPGISGTAGIGQVFLALFEYQLLRESVLIRQKRPERRLFLVLWSRKSARLPFPRSNSVVIRFPEMLTLRLVAAYVAIPLRGDFVATNSNNMSKGCHESV
jgi:hypothetical protein